VGCWCSPGCPRTCCANGRARRRPRFH